MEVTFHVDPLAWVPAEFGQGLETVEVPLPAKLMGDGWVMKLARVVHKNGRIRPELSVVLKGPG